MDSAHLNYIIGNTTMNAFTEFRADALAELAARKIDRSTVSFVNIGGSKWMTIEDFEATCMCEPCEEVVHNDFGNWSHIPRGFAIVIRDGRWLHYESCPDPMHSKWRLSSTPARPPKRMLAC